jgi:Skp family chaperone for outer membrane proteins
MKPITKFLAPATLAISAAIAAPAAAQVQGPIASVDITDTVFRSSAFATAYNQVSQTYGPQIEQRRQKNEERQTFLKAFDKNGDNEVDDAELAAAQRTPQYARYQALEQELAQLSAQIDGARVFAIEQILGQVPAAVQQVVTDKKIALVIDPSVILFGPQEVDITEAVANALNIRLPRVEITPPPGWQPQRQSLQMYQEVQQLLIAVAMQQAQQQAQAQQGEQPAAPQPEFGAEVPEGR